jgi:hypothetical protein
MHALARWIHLWKATNKWDNTSALPNLQNQKWTNEAKRSWQCHTISRKHFTCESSTRSNQNIYIATWGSELFWFEAAVYEGTTITIKLLVLRTSVNKCVPTASAVLPVPCVRMWLLEHCTNLDNTEHQHHTIITRRYTFILPFQYVSASFK